MNALSDWEKFEADISSGGEVKYVVMMSHLDAFSFRLNKDDEPVCSVNLGENPSIALIHPTRRDSLWNTPSRCVFEGDRESVIAELHKYMSVEFVENVLFDHLVKNYPFLADVKRMVLTKP